MIKNNIIYKNISRIFNLLPKVYRKKAAIQFIFIIINSFVDLVGLAAIIPLLAALLKEGFIHEQKQLNWLYTTFGFEEDKWFIVFVCLAVVILVVSKNLFGLWVNKRQVSFSWGIYEYLSERMFISTYNKGLEYFNNENSNIIQNRIVRIPQILSTMITTGLIQFLNELVILICVIISVTIYDPKIIFILLFTILPLFFGFYKLNAEKIKSIQMKMNELLPEVTKPVYELTFGYVDIVISGLFNSFKSLFTNKVSKMKEQQIKYFLLVTIPPRLVEISVIGTVIIVLLYGLFALENIESIVSLLAIFGLAAYRIVPSANRLMMALINIKGGEYTIDTIEKYLAIKEPKNDTSTITYNDNIILKDVCFQFSDSNVKLLDQISLEIKKGEVIGLVGRSGSGKTTLMNILLGFVKPTSGSIVIDETILNETNKIAWQKLIGYVRQDVFLIDGTIAENIAFGVEKDLIDYEKMERAIKTASLNEFISIQPENINTLIGERGAKISGGQRQRIGIARAIYHGAEVLFFDEATSALDEKTEQEITEAIETLNQYNLTMIIIAHRTSSLKYCNKIYQIENSKLSLETINKF